MTSILAVTVNGQSLAGRWPLRLNLKRAIDQSKTNSSDPNDSAKESAASKANQPAKPEQPAKAEQPAAAASVEERLRALEQIIELQRRELQALKQIIEARDSAVPGS